LKPVAVARRGPVDTLFFATLVPGGEKQLGRYRRLYQPTRFSAFQRALEIELRGDSRHGFFEVIGLLVPSGQPGQIGPVFQVQEMKYLFSIKLVVG